MRTVREVILSPTRSRWGHMKNGHFEEKTNFALRLKYSVVTSLPSGPGYVVDVVRSADKKKGTAFFLCSHPQKDVHHFVQAIQTSFKVDNKPQDGGFYSTLTKNELIRLVTDLDQELRESGEAVYKKTLVQCVGSQPNSDVTLLNPSQMFSGAGVEIKLEDSSYIWIESWPGSPPAHLYRSVEAPFSLAAIGDWLGQACTIQGHNFPATLMALGATIGMCAYRHLLQIVGHFNLPLMYGPPMSGKTLTAQCIAKITGADSFYSRCTLAALTELCSMSTIPIVWDDPTDAADVCQLAVDLGNGATRGTRDRVIVPQTGCLVTANFNLGEAMKYYSRLNLIVFKKAEVVDVGHATQLEEAASKASAALPAMMCLAQSITSKEIRERTQQILEVCRVLEVRLVEGISVALTVMTKILDALGLPWGDHLFTYIQAEIIPMHMRRLGHLKDQPKQQTGPKEKLVKELLLQLSEEQVQELLRFEGSTLAIRAVELPHELQKRVRETAGGRTKNIRIGGLKKAKKCRVLDLEDETDVVSALFQQHQKQVHQTPEVPIIETEVPEGLNPEQDEFVPEVTEGLNPGANVFEADVSEGLNPGAAMIASPVADEPEPEPEPELCKVPEVQHHQDVKIVEKNPVFTLVVKKRKTTTQQGDTQSGQSKRSVRKKKKCQQDDFIY